MKNIKEVEIEGEKLYLKKNQYLGWVVIHPYKTDGQINWKNLLIGGNWIRFGMIVLMIILILLAIFEYANAVNIANDCLQKLQTPQINLSQWIN